MLKEYMYKKFIICKSFAISLFSSALRYVCNAIWPQTNNGEDSGDIETGDRDLGGSNHEGGLHDVDLEDSDNKVEEESSEVTNEIHKRIAESSIENSNPSGDLKEAEDQSSSSKKDIDPKNISDTFSIGGDWVFPDSDDERGVFPINNDGSGLFGLSSSDHGKVE